MKTLAIFSDIHANLPALRAVLADMNERGLQNRYCLGDLVGYRCRFDHAHRYLFWIAENLYKLIH